MAIKQNMDKPIFSANNGRVYAIADEANDGIKAVPAELVLKASDDSTFTQISDDNPLPVKMNGEVDLSVDPSNPLPVTGAVQLTGSNLGKADVQTVTTAGSRVQLPDVECKEVTLIGLKGNTGTIFVGGSDVSSVVFGAELEPKDSITIPVSNANQIYIDAEVSGEGVSYVAI